VTEPTSSARDSSLQDRKAPENCLLRTRQPRSDNVMRNGGRRHFISASPRAPPSPRRGEGQGEGIGKPEQILGLDTPYPVLLPSGEKQRSAPLAAPSPLAGEGGVRGRAAGLGVADGPSAACFARGLSRGRER